MNGLDWLVVALVAVSAISGLIRGGARTVVGLLGWILGAMLALRFGVQLGDLLLTSIRNPALRGGLAMVIVFLVMAMLGGIAGALLGQFVRRIGLGSGDRWLGAIFGAVRGFVLVLALVVAAGLTPLPQSTLWRASYFGPRLEALAIEVKPWLPESLAAMIHFGTEI